MRSLRFLSGVSYCLSEAAISASRSSTRRAKAAMVQSSTVSPGRITRLKSSWGSRLCAALSECTDRTPGYGWRDGSGRRCFGRYRNASWQFSFFNRVGLADGQAFQQGVGHLGCDFRSPAAVFLKAGGGGSVGRIGDGANGEEWDAVCMADMGNGRGFHIRAKGVKCGPHGLCPRAREKGFSGHHPPEADGAAGVLGRLGGQGEQEGVPGNQMESIQGWNSVRISSATS